LLSPVQANLPLLSPQDLSLKLHGLSGTLCLALDPPSLKDTKKGKPPSNSYLGFGLVSFPTSLDYPPVHPSPTLQIPQKVDETTAEWIQVSHEGGRRRGVDVNRREVREDVVGREGRERREAGKERRREEAAKMK
jgi:hypothetical protein